MMKSAQYYFIFKAWQTGEAGSWFHHRVTFSSSSFVALCLAVAGGLRSTTGSSTSGDTCIWGNCRSSGDSLHSAEVKIVVVVV